ncbi:MAG TPA: hypothetical protein VHZ96_11565 [Frankiaceae bacterium]|jgi:hypothetical protein|nr:hypothetical protein [Frankiaceae bacterium]
MDPDIQDVARSIRPYLPQLLGDESADYDRRLVALLASSAQGADTDDALLDLLTSHPDIHGWASAMLEDERHLPPDVRQEMEHVRQVERGLPDAGFSPLANPYGGDPVDAEKFVCPRDGNYVWWRVSVGMQVPTCRDHPDDVLVPAAP